MFFESIAKERICLALLGQGKHFQDCEIQTPKYPVCKSQALHLCIHFYHIQKRQSLIAINRRLAVILEFCKHSTF
jgi:hypothetical protein